jgi:multidrug resistance efflux pump
LSEGLNRQLLRITVLLQLEQRAREADDPQQLAFVFVNESYRLVPYQQAAFWEGDARGRGRVRAVSGVAVTDPNGPYNLWLARVARTVASSGRGGAAHAFGTGDLPDSLARDWAEWLPERALWLPFHGARGRLRGGLILARPEAWRESDLHLAGYLQSAYAHAWEALRHRRPKRTGTLAPAVRRTALLAATAGVIALMFVPVRQSALAPAEIVPRDPSLVRAPVEGVIDRIHVEPNQPVEAGTLLASLDSQRLDSRIEVARKTAEVSEVEYRQAAQRAVFDPDARAELPRLKGNFEEARAELDYLTALRERLEVRAPQAGVAVFDDVTDWLGKPVKIGERIMLLADPQRLELEMTLPIENAIRLETGAPVQLFLNLRPDRPVAAELTQASYRARSGTDGSYSYRLEGRFTDPDAELHLGLKGTAKIYGERVPLGYYLFRRPIGVVRTWLGL